MKNVILTIAFAVFTLTTIDNTNDVNATDGHTALNQGQKYQPQTKRSSIKKNLQKVKETRHQHSKCNNHGFKNLELRQLLVK